MHDGCESPCAAGQIEETIEWAAVAGNHRRTTHLLDVALLRKRRRRNDLARNLSLLDNVTVQIATCKASLRRWSNGRGVALGRYESKRARGDSPFQANGSGHIHELTRHQWFAADRQRAPGRPSECCCSQALEQARRAALLTALQQALRWQLPTCVCCVVNYAKAAFQTRLCATITSKRFLCGNDLTGPASSPSSNQPRLVKLL